MSLIILWSGIGITALVGGVVKLRATERNLQAMLADVVAAPEPAAVVAVPLRSSERLMPASLADVVPVSQSFAQAA